ncbi:hypothetical protein BN159_1285 [Streptomyces davaonensis JCM 4913]|uniref:Uncharacterized protein n=1 Tax=Streptomyces davaonensis (strain DSM 101723 / JCM 4913 / KCC S-0913 / 768) TaxID=1214101 RepID=K4QZ48_STRDJ|nr:hypothetical protein BN159_1285 [Streptomyces davaonensis JCM 4913]
MLGAGLGVAEEGSVDHVRQTAPQVTALAGFFRDI